MVDDIVTFLGGESGEWLSLANCYLGEGDTDRWQLPNLVINNVLGLILSEAIFPAWVNNFRDSILSELERHIPQNIQLLTGILFICFCGL